MGTIHFVYVKPGAEAQAGAGAPAWWRWARSAGEKLRGATGENGPMPAPYSITVNLERFLRARGRVRVYDWRETGAIELGEDDILIGHPHADPDTLVQQTLRRGVRCRLRALMFPIHHGMPEISAFTLPLVEQADVVFGITGPYWHDTLGQSHFAPWKKKFVRLDLAVDAEEYPLVKRRFNPAGQRGYLYIGNNRPEKGSEVLSATLGRLKEFPRGWVGGGPEIAEVPRIATYRRLDREFISALAEKFDIFVNTSVSDANPATILEAMAWGFPVACTPQSGYYKMPTIVELSTTDVDANERKLREMQEAPEEQLVAVSRKNRELVETQYTWERFCGTVWKQLRPYT